MSKLKKAVRPASVKRRSQIRAPKAKKHVTAQSPAKTKNPTKGTKGNGKTAGNGKNFEAKAAALIQKGRDRGFVTYDEILKEFPQIENDIVFLDPGPQ